MPTTKDCSLESQKQSIQKFVNRRAKFLKLAIDSVLNQATDNGKELTRRVMRKLVEECGLSKKFTIQEVVALRDFMQCGTNVIDRLKCGVETLDAMLEFLPSCIKQQLAEFDASNNLELVVAMHDLITSKESMKREQIGVMIVKHPWKMLEMMNERSLIERKYVNSIDYMKVPDKLGLTYNIDKGGDMINATIRILNRPK